MGFGIFGGSKVERGRAWSNFEWYFRVLILAYIVNEIF